MIDFESKNIGKKCICKCISVIYKEKHTVLFIHTQLYLHTGKSLAFLGKLYLWYIVSLIINIVKTSIIS